MAEYIEREATCRDCFHYDVCDYHITELTQMTVNECPHKFVNKVDVVEVKHGHWEEVKEVVDWLDDDVEVYYVCSICGCNGYCESPYCPNCGAKMDGKEG